LVLGGKAMADVHVLFKFAPNPYGGVEIDTTANSGRWSQLSPFLLSALEYGSRNFENLWQYSKVYEEHVSLDDGEPTLEWVAWRYAGLANPIAVRYPMGKGVKPEYSYWNGEKLGYIEARKKIYAPIYAELVAKTVSYGLLCSLHEAGEVLVLRDYDAYDRIKLGVTLVDVINNPDKKMGHAFVLAMMLTGVLDKCLEK